jgi:hypothetical protein
VNTDRRRITIAAVLGLAVLGLNSFAIAQDDSKKADDSKRLAGDKDKKDDKQKDYGVIFGTAYGPDDRPLYGVRVTIHPVGKKHPSWELVSDHRGEFAQRVPPAPADYLVTGEAEVAAIVNGKPQRSKKQRLKGEARVHIDGAEWRDFSLHLN